MGFTHERRHSLYLVTETLSEAENHILTFVTFEPCLST